MQISLEKAGSESFSKANPFRSFFCVMYNIEDVDIGCSLLVIHKCLYVTVSIIRVIDETWTQFRGSFAFRGWSFEDKYYR